jgi:hypothetical protein
MNVRAVLGVLLIAVAAALAGGGVYAVQRLKLKSFDSSTLCPAEGSKAVSLILVDKTDPLTEAERSATRGLVSAEAAAVERGNRITVRVLRQGEGTDAVALDTAADLCNPGAEANPLFENPKRVAARYENAFRAPLGEALESAGNTSSSQTSPIAQAIRESLTAIPESPGQRLKLILVSDLMEHTPEASAYAGTLSESVLRMAIPLAAQERLQGAEIRVLLLARPHYAKQQAAAIAVWRRMLKSLTGREPEVLQP